MSLTKYAFFNTLTYGLALFGPALLLTLLHEFFGIAYSWQIPLILVAYCLGAGLMLGFIPRLKTPLKVEEKAVNSSNKKAIVEGLIGIAIVICVQGVANVVEMSITGQAPSSANTDQIMAIIKSNLLFTIVVSIVGPIMEELFFRRTLLGLFGNYFGFWPATILSSFLFFLAHQDGHFLVYFAMGLTLSLLYRSTGKITTSIIAHCGMNTFVILMQLLLLPYLT